MNKNDYILYNIVYAHDQKLTLPISDMIKYVGEVLSNGSLSYTSAMQPRLPKLQLDCRSYDQMENHTLYVKHPTIQLIKKDSEKMRQL